MNVIGKSMDYLAGENSYHGKKSSVQEEKKEQKWEPSDFALKDYELVLSKEGETANANVQIRQCTKEENALFERSMNDTPQAIDYAAMGDDAVGELLASRAAAQLIIGKQTERGQALSFEEKQAMRAYAKAMITPEMIAERKAKVDKPPRQELQREDTLSEITQWIKLLPGLWGTWK